MQKSLLELFNDKALSLMGDRRIKLFNHPHNCKDGAIVGVENGLLNLVMDDGKPLCMPPSNYLENFKYAHPEGGIKTALSKDGKEAVRVPRPYAEMFKDFDVVRNERDFKIASRVAPNYTDWELIKAADQVSVLSKLMTSADDNSDLFTIEAQTPRGLYRSFARLEQLTLNAADAESLPYAPGSAIGLADDLLKNWFSTRDPGIENKIFDELADDEIDGHYLIGSIDQRHRSRDDVADYCDFLDDKGEWVSDHTQAIAIPYGHGFDGQQRNDPELVWKDFLACLFNPKRELLIVPANRLSIEPEQRMS